MAKLTLTDLANLNNPTSAVATLAANNTLIETAMENTLSRDGTSPNSMSADLDMGGNQILNLPEAEDPTDPIRLGELEDLVEDIVDAAVAAVATGPQGPPGENGTNGTNGADGEGVPAGGTTGQLLAKINATDFNTEWVDPSSSSLDRDRYEPPLAASFATLVGTNSQDPTATDTAGRGLVLGFGTTPAAGDNVRCVLKAKTAGASQSIILRQDPIFLGHRFIGAGLALRESGSGEILTFTINNMNIAGTDYAGAQLKVTRWTNATTFSSDRLAAQLAVVPEWLKITLTSDDPADFFISQNGTDWIQVLDESQTAFLTFDQVGFSLIVNQTGGVQAVSGTQQLINNILYYSDAGIIP